MSNGEWWQRTTVYQIYPRSYKDSTGNGIGDLPGIIEKLEYIADLGIETIWFSPFYPSPQEDHGYDISDYTDINPEYGTMADFDKMLKKAHDLGLKIVLDMVLNHTSDKHPWFLESKSSKDNPKRDWYVWRDGRKAGGKSAPNNWKRMTGWDSAWEYDPTADQWFLARFLACQPELNYRNPKVKETIFDCVRFWLDKGVDGYRLDIFHTIYEDEHLQNNPFGWGLLPSDTHSIITFQNHIHDMHQPETMEFARELHRILDEYDPPRFLVGEITAPPEILREYLGEQNEGLHMVFNFNFLACRYGAKKYYRVISHIEELYAPPITPTYVYSNHDRMRIFSRLSENWDKMKLLATLQLTMRGVPFIYYGDEIGMSQVKVKLRHSEDPIGRKYKWLPISQSKYFAFAFSRDGCRTPMQWSDEPNAGFSPDSNAKTWLKVGSKYKHVNVAVQDKDPNSLLNLYRNLLHIRRENIALQAGTFEFLQASNKHLTYKRVHPEQSIIVCLNFKNKTLIIPQPSPNLKLLFSTHPETELLIGENLLELKPYQGLILLT